MSRHKCLGVNVWPRAAAAAGGDIDSWTQPGYIVVVSLILHVRDRIPINRTAIELLSAAAAGKCAGIY